MPPVGPIDRRGALTAGVAGALGITTTVLPAASAAATGAAPQVAAPSAPVTGATVAGGVVSITLAVAPTGGSHTYALWRDTVDVAGDPTPSTTGTATDGAVTLTIGGGSDADAALDEGQSHVIRVTHTNSGGSATSTLAFTPRSLGPTTGGSASSQTGGAGVVSATATISHPVAGFGPSAVTFTLAGAAGGKGGDDDGKSGGNGGVGASITGRLAVSSGDVLQVHAGGRGGDGATGSSSTDAGTGGRSTVDFAYVGGTGGAPGTSGASGGGAGGGAATVLRRDRAGVHLDVVAAGGGGGGGSGRISQQSLDGRDADADTSTATTEGGAGVSPGGNDGGGGGGGGGGTSGGAGGDLFIVTEGVESERFGRGGRRGLSSATGGDLDAVVASVAASAAPGTGTLTWHDVAVTHTPDVTVVPTSPVTAAGVAGTSAGGTLTLILRAAAGDGSGGLGTHTFQVWEGSAGSVDPTGTADRSGTAPAGSTSLTVSGLDAEQPHVVTVTHTVGDASASSTVTLAAQSLSATDGTAGGAGSSGGAGGTGGAGSSSESRTLSLDGAFVTTAVAFDLVGGSGGRGGEDGGKIGGSGGSGGRLQGSLLVRDGDQLVLHTGGGGGAGADGSGSEDGGGDGGTSPITGQYAGGDGGFPKPSSGGGGGGGAATVLRRTRGAATLDVVAAGGGGGGGSGFTPLDERDPMNARAWDAGDAGSGTSGGGGAAPVSDGGGGGGGGGGERGGGGGGVFQVAGAEWFGYGGRRGLSTSDSSGGDVTASASTSGSAGAGGTAILRYHTLTVSHSA